MLRRLRIENLVLIREAELDLAPGLNAITGETGAGKTILAQSIGLLLGARGNATMIGPAGEEAYVEAELDGEPNEALAELQPSAEPGLVLARRIFADGRTRAYAWGRAAPREDVAAAAEQAIAMSGQFQQRRLARPSYQLDLLDAFAGATPLRARAATAWRELAAARKRHDETAASAARTAERLAELRALVEDTEGLEPDTETELRARRETLQHLEELVDGAAAAAEALAPEEGEGAALLAARAERAIAPLESLAPELARAGDELRDVELRLRETASDLRGYLATLGSEPERLEETEAQLERIADTRRRFHCETYEELLARAAEARAELAAVDAGVDPSEAAARGTRRGRGASAGAGCRAARRARAGGAALGGSGVGRARGAGPRGRRVPGRGLAARPRSDGRRRGAVPDPAESGPTARAGRRHGVGRRAVADRAGDRGRRRRGHAGLRRARRGNRRRDRATPSGGRSSARRSRRR